MSIITDYAEKINKVYNDSTLSKGEYNSRLKDLLLELAIKYHDIGYSKGETHTKHSFKERLKGFFD